MNKSYKLKHIIRESIKQLMTEQFTNYMEILATICDPQPGESTQEWGYPSQTQFAKIRWSNGNTPQLGEFFISTARGSGGQILNYSTTWVVTSVGVTPSCTSGTGCATRDQSPNCASSNTFIYGCTDPTSFNYDPLATHDCDAPPISPQSLWPNIMDPLTGYGCCGNNDSCNSDCCYVSGCTDPSAPNNNPNACHDDGSCGGCVDASALNYCPLCPADCLGVVGGTDNSCCNYTPIPGCIEPTAINYNPNANTDDGSCEWEGCTDPTANNHSFQNFQPPVPQGGGQYLNGYSYDDGSCEWHGCTDPTAGNYSFPGSNVTQNGDPYLTGIAVDDGTCDYTNLLIEGCADPTAVHCNTLPQQLQFGCYKQNHDGCGTPPNSNDTSCCQYGIIQTFEPTIDGNKKCPICCVPDWVLEMNPDLGGYIHGQAVFDANIIGGPGSPYYTPPLPNTSPIANWYWIPCKCPPDYTQVHCGDIGSPLQESIVPRLQKLANIKTS